MPAGLPTGRLVAPPYYVRVTCALLMVLLSSAAVGGVLAQGGPPGGPTIYSIQSSGSISPLTGSKVIGGTEFPWVKADITRIPLTGGFTVVGTPGVTASMVTVKVNEKPCTVTQDPNTPTNGTWKHDNASDPISVGAGPGVFPLTVKHFHNGNLIAQGGTVTRQLQVYKVERVEHQLEFDIVEANSNLRWDDSEQPVWVRTNMLDGVNTREVAAYFKVTAPPLANGDFSGLTVGLNQTVTNDIPGAVQYHKTGGALGGNTGTLTYTLLQSPPIVDSVDQALPYYSASARRSTAAGEQGNVINGNVWTNGQHNPLHLRDSPAEALADQPSPSVENWPYPGSTYGWGVIFGNRRTRDGSLTHWDFIVIMAANSSDCQGVYVPIHGYLSWHVEFTGYLDLLTSQWVGGMVGATGSILDRPKTEGMRFNSSWK